MYIKSLLCDFLDDGIISSRGDFVVEGSDFGRLAGHERSPVSLKTKDGKKKRNMTHLCNARRSSARERAACMRRIGKKNS